MNLETRLDKSLWEAARTSFESRNYAAAVLDAIHYLTDIIRERSGLDGDGVALIGAAFGGKTPKLRVNRLQTESEQNIQRGIEALLRGLYQAIRNPRSHESKQDTEQDCVSILLFVDFLLRIVNESRVPFSLPLFAGRVVDPDFVPSKRYADLLVTEIPANKRLAVCQEIIARRSETAVGKVRYFFDAIWSFLKTEEIDELAQAVSQELRDTNESDVVRFVIGAFPTEFWPRIAEVARMRAENKLIESVSQGRWIEASDNCASGALGTWATSVMKDFVLKEKLWSVIWRKLASDSVEEQDYVFKYFANRIQDHFASPPSYLVLIVKGGIRRGDARFRTLAESWKYKDFMDERAVDDPWRIPFLDILEHFVEVEHETVFPDDEIPF